MCYTLVTLCEIFLSMFPERFQACLMCVLRQTNNYCITCTTCYAHDSWIKSAFRNFLVLVCLVLPTILV